MSRTEDLAGRQFGFLKVLHRAPGKKHAWWTCLCQCGATTVTTSQSLRRGNMKSCGCFRRKRMAELKLTHGMSYSPEYTAWVHIIQRCTNPKHPIFKDYGGRGITVCQTWEDSFEAFYADIGPRPSKKHTVERIDNGRGYAPGNVKWATRSEQAINRRSSRLLTWNGQTKTLMDWSRETGIPYQRLRKRVMRHNTLEQIFQRTTIKPPGRPVER